MFTARYGLNIYVKCRLISINAEAWIRSWTTAYDFCGGQSCTETYSPLSTSVFSCHLSTTIASNSSLSTRSYQKENGRNLGTFRKAVSFRKSGNFWIVMFLISLFRMLTDILSKIAFNSPLLWSCIKVVFTFQNMRHHIPFVIEMSRHLC